MTEKSDAQVIKDEAAAEKEFQKGTAGVSEASNKSSTGDTAAGLKADGKDVSASAASNRPTDANVPVIMKRLLGTEEIEVKVSRQSLRVVDKNGRKLEVGQVVNLRVRILSFGPDNQIEVVYPPYINEGPKLNDKKDGLVTIDDRYKVVDGKIVNVADNKPYVVDSSVKVETQHKLTVKADKVERF